MRRLLLVSVCLVAFAAAPAAAQDAPGEALAAIREQVLHADYRSALDAVTAYVERDDLDAAHHNAGLEVLATIHIALRNAADAEATLARLYARDPGHRLEDPDASPPVIAAFGRARARPPAPLPVSLADRTAALDARAAPRVVVALDEGAGLISELRLRYRHGDGDFTGVVMAREGDEARARIPLLDRPDAYEVAYIVEARAPSGHVLARIGTEAEPASLTVPARAVATVAAPDDPAPVVVEEEPGDDGLVIGVVLGVIGALVVGGAVLAGVLIADATSGPQDGSLGNIDLPLIRF